MRQRCVAKRLLEEVLSLARLRYGYDRMRGANYYRELAATDRSARRAPVPERDGDALSALILVIVAIGRGRYGNAVHADADTVKKPRL